MDMLQHHLRPNRNQSEASSFSPDQYQCCQQLSARYSHGGASGLSHPQYPNLLIKGLASIRSKLSRFTLGYMSTMPWFWTNNMSGLL